MVNHCEGFFIITFYKNFIKFRNMFNPLKVIYRQSLWYCAIVQIIYTSSFKIWRSFIFIVIYIFITIVYTSVSRVTYFTSNSFSTINSISISVNNSDFASVFLKLLAKLIRELKENVQGLTEKKNHQLKVTYHF